VRNFGFEKYDVVILSDVLHYLNESSQVELLKKSVNSLNRNGIILIRDGFQDIGKKHKNTRLTELFSTNVGFNKMENKKMNFITINWLTELVRNLGMGMEVISQQKNTSNSLIKLYRKENDL
jgi:2-polyprenyl-3-methyl-5-hydroxy-6-metoxy-1,4-benzoquinol methylase